MATRPSRPLGKDAGNGLKHHTGRVMILAASPGASPTCRLAMEASRLRRGMAARERRRGTRPVARLAARNPGPTQVPRTGPLKAANSGRVRLPARSNGQALASKTDTAPAVSTGQGADLVPSSGPAPVLMEFLVALVSRGQAGRQASSSLLGSSLLVR